MPNVIPVCLVLCVVLLPILASASQDASDPASEGMTLAQALERAHAANPDLEAARLRVQAADARARQQGLPQNPTLSVEVENVIGSGIYEGDDLGETTVYLTQPLEFWGKRGKRGRAAELAGTVAEAEAAVLRAHTDEAVTSAFFGVLAAQARENLSRERVDSLEDAGRSAEAAAARTGLENDRAALASARVALAIATGLETRALPRVVGDLEETQPLPDLETLLERDPLGSEARLWQARVEAGEAAVTYQRALRVPDVSLSAGYRRFNEVDEQAAIFYLSVPLPLFDTNRGEVDAAGYELDEAKLARRSAERHWQAHVLDAHRALMSAKREVDAHRAAETPSARRAYIDALERYHRAQARLHRLTARSES